MNNNTILVSVCIQTFNQKNYIKQCLDGVLMQQTNFSIEIILGEDDSSDGTREICIDYAEQHPEQIRLFLRDRKDVIFIGGNATGRFNFIENLKESKGKYIALCEGDDYWTDPLKLQKQVDFLEENSEYSMCFHDAWVIKDEKKINLYVNQEKSIFTTEDLFKRHFIPTASIVFRNMIQQPQWFYKIASGDRLLLFLLSLQGKIKCLTEVMSVYRLHSGGVSNTHYGIKKVYDTALLLHLFDESTNYKFTKECHDSLVYEIQIHLGSSLKSNNFSVNDLDAITFKILLKTLVGRIKKKFKEKLI